MPPVNQFNDFSDKQLVNFVATQFTDYIVFLKSWSETLFSVDLAIPDEIKNRIFTIWFGATFELIVEIEKRHLPLIGALRERGLMNTFEVHMQYANLMESARKIFGRYAMEEQMVIRHLRHTYVHGRVSGLSRPTPKRVEFIDPQSMQYTEVSLEYDDYWARWDDVVNNQIDEFLSAARARFFDPETEYFRNWNRLEQPGMITRVLAMAYEDLPEDEMRDWYEKHTTRYDNQ